MEPSRTIDVLRNALIGKPYRQGMAIRAFSTWVPIWRVLQEYRETHGEHILIFYARSESAGKASGCVRARIEEDCADDLRQTTESALTGVFGQVFMLDPHRVTIPAVPGLLAMRRHYEHRASQKDMRDEMTVTGLESLLGYGKRLLEARKAMTRSISDTWAPYVLPQWAEPTTVYFLLDRSMNAFVQVEGISQNAVVQGEEVDKIDFRPDRVDALVDAALARRKDLFETPLGNKCRWSTSTIVVNPVKDAFEAFDKAVREVNTRLVTISSWHLRKLASEDYMQLVRDDIEGHRWLRDAFGLGEQEWMQPVNVRLFVYADKRLPATDNEIISHVVYPSTTQRNEINVNLGSKPEAQGELLRDLTARRVPVIHASSSMADFWLDGRNLEPFIAPDSGLLRPRRDELPWRCER